MLERNGKKNAVMAAPPKKSGGSAAPSAVRTSKKAGTGEKASVTTRSAAVNNSDAHGTRLSVGSKDSEPSSVRKVRKNADALVAKKPAKNADQLLAKKPQKNSGVSESPRLAPTGAKKPTEKSDRMTLEQEKSRKLEKKRKAEIRKTKSMKKLEKFDLSDLDSPKKKKKDKNKDRDDEKKKAKAEKKKAKEESEKAKEENERLLKVQETMRNLYISPMEGVMAVVANKDAILKPPGEILEQYRVADGDLEVEIEEENTNNVAGRQFERKPRPPKPLIESEGNRPPTDTVSEASSSPQKSQGKSIRRDLSLSCMTVVNTFPYGAFLFLTTALPVSAISAE